MTPQALRRTIGRPLDQEASAFDLTRSLADLRAEPALAREGRNSIILHKEQGLKVVLIAMRAGNEIRSHRAAAPIAVQALEGSVALEAGGKSYELRPGQLLTLHAGLEHAVRALEESAFLLTLAGPNGH